MIVARLLSTCLKIRARPSPTRWSESWPGICPIMLSTHTYPSVPFHKLPTLHELIKDHIKETEQGYINFSKKYISSLDR